MSASKNARSSARRPAARSTAPRQSAQQRLSTQRAAAARERIAAAQRRRRLFVVGGAVLAVLVVVAVLVIVRVATNSGGPKSGTKASGAQASVVSEVSSVPATALNSVGVGTVKAYPTPITAPALTDNGKPAVLYVGAEYCPYCAAERWAVAVALSRFGTLHGLGQTTSSPSDVFPSTATLSFHGATYTSSYLSFTGKEIQSNQVVNGEYASLDTLTAAQQALYTKYDKAPYVSSSGIPFVDFGGKFLISGASYDPGVLQGKSHAQIAAALSDPTSATAKAVDGAANVVSAAICAQTDQQPASVCTSSGVRAAASKLGTG